MALTAEQTIEIRFALRDEVGKAVEQQIAKLRSLNDIRFDKAHESFAGLSKVAGKVGREIKEVFSLTGISGIVGAGGIIAGLAAAKKGLDDFVQTGLKQTYLARQLGVSKDTLDDYTDALKVVGQGQGEAADNVKSALETLEQAYSKGIHSPLFEELKRPEWGGRGIQLFKEITDAYAKGPEKALDTTVEILARLEKQDVRAAAAFAKATGLGTLGAADLKGILGRLIPTINLSKAEMLEYSLANVNLDRSWENVKVTIGRSLLPAFTSLNQAITEYLSSEAGQKLLKDIQQWIDSIAATIRGGSFSKELEGRVDGLKTLVKDFTTAFSVADEVVQKLGGWPRVFEALVAIEVAKWIYGVVAALRSLSLILASPIAAGLTLMAALIWLAQQSRSWKWWEYVDPSKIPGHDWLNEHAKSIFGGRKGDQQPELPPPISVDPMTGMPMMPVIPQSYREEGREKTPQEQSADAALDQQAKTQLTRQFAALDYELDKLNAYLLPGGPEGRAGGGSGYQLSSREDVVERSSYTYLLDNPNFVARMASMAKGEMGAGAGTVARRAITEQALNRWYANNRTREWIEGGADLYHGRKGYYAADTFKSVTPGEIDAYKRDVLTPVITEGTNEARGTTGNASNPRGNPVALHQFRHGTPGFWMNMKTGAEMNLPANYAKSKAEAMFVEGMKRKLPVRQPVPGFRQFNIPSLPMPTELPNINFASESVSGSADVDIDISGVTRSHDQATVRETLFKPMIVPRTPQMAATGSDRAAPSPFNAS